MVYFKVIGHSKDHFLNGTLWGLWKICQSRKYSEFLLHFKFIKCFSLILMICNHFVGKTANQRYNDAYDWCGDVCFLRELLQRWVPVWQRAMSSACVCVWRPSQLSRPNRRDKLQPQTQRCSAEYIGRFSHAPNSSYSLPCLTECGGQKTGPSGYLSSPNHPRNYPHQQVRFWAVRHLPESCTSLNSAGSVCPQLCTWHLSVEEGHVITLSFRNFSLETQDVCEFDYVEVHDSLNTRTGRVLGRWDAPFTFFKLVCLRDRCWILFNSVRGHVFLFQPQFCLFVSGSVVAPFLQIWRPPAPTWPWCSWLMRESQTADSMPPTRLCRCWTVSSCCYKTYLSLDLLW